MDAQTHRKIYDLMLRIRRVEEAVADKYGEQKMRCPVHLSIGQEAVPACLSAQLTAEDHVYSTHRCHAHYIAKGGSINAMIAELYGKQTGCAKGKGGSMHLVDTSCGMMGSSALVGGSIPLAVGSALTMSFAKTNHLAVAYFGDGGSEEGIFYESLNFAALKKLPVLFVVENNLYATYSHQNARQATTDIHTRGESFGVPGEQADGYDVASVYEVTKRAVDRARSGQGPTVLEFKTYRWRDHVGPNYDIEVGYRTEEDVKAWEARCPIKASRQVLLESGATSADELSASENQLNQEIEQAFVFAEQSPFPEPKEMFEDIYA